MTSHCHPDSEVYILPNTHVLGISLVRVRKPEDIFKLLTIRGATVHAGGRIRNRNLPISSSSRYKYRHGWHGVGGMGVASEFSSVEKISRWHKLEKKEVRIGIWKTYVDIIP